jgi:hypothetical protein
MQTAVHGAIEPRKPFALPLPSHVERSPGDWALRCIDLARLAVQKGLLAAARVNLRAALTFARDVESADLRHVLAVEISAARDDVARTCKQRLTVHPEQGFSPLGRALESEAA